jgi:hypothetical protein
MDSLAEYVYEIKESAGTPREGVSQHVPLAGRYPKETI